MRSNFPDTRSNTFMLYDKQAYVKLLRRHLSLKENGKIDSVFRDKVEALQEKHGLTANGIVDIRTHAVIIKQQKGSVNFDYLDEGEEVKRINLAISSLINKYGLPIRSPRGRFVTVDTVIAVRKLREIYCLPSADVIDDAFLKCLRMDI